MFEDKLVELKDVVKKEMAAKNKPVYDLSYAIGLSNVAYVNENALFLFGYKDTIGKYRYIDTLMDHRNIVRIDESLANKKNVEFVKKIMIAGYELAIKEMDCIVSADYKPNPTFTHDNLVDELDSFTKYKGGDMYLDFTSFITEHAEYIWLLREKLKVLHGKKEEHEIRRLDYSSKRRKTKILLDELNWEGTLREFENRELKDLKTKEMQFLVKPDYNMNILD